MTSTARFPVPVTSRFDGQLLTPGSPGYDSARSVWNAMIDRRPALIAWCASVADVVAAVRTGRERDLEIGVRCGGHSMPFATGAYVNALSDEGAAGLICAYSDAKCARLIAVKDLYDPDRVFHLNHNIVPNGH